MKQYSFILIILSVILILSVYGLTKNGKEGFTEGTQGSSFVSRIPQGAIIAFSPPDGNTQNIPPGWAPCDGGVHNGVTTPNLSGKFIMGYSDTTCNITSDVGKDCNQLLGTGGEYKHTLLIDEMPKHTHGYAGLANTGGGGHGNDWNSTTWQTDPTGLDQAHNNTPPYIVLMYIMKL